MDTKGYGDIIPPAEIQSFLDNAVGGANQKWEKVENVNNNGLLFKEWVDQNKKHDEL